MIYCCPYAHASEAEDGPTSSAQDWAEQTAEERFQQSLSIMLEMYLQHHKSREFCSKCSAF